MIPFYIYDSFTRTPYAGNPAGVFLDAEGLSAEQMRAMAAEVSLESAFVARADGGLALRYFTPTAEVPLCGHATVAAFTALAREGRVPVGERVPFTCPAGHLSVTLADGEDGVVVHLEQAAPVLGETAGPDDLYDIASSLGATPNDLHPQLPIQVVSTGSAWMFVPVTGRAVVDAAPGDLALIARISETFGALGLYVFSLDTRARGITDVDPPMVYARCFAPAFGLDEDPVTGSASGALGCYLARWSVVDAGAPMFIAEQGTAIGRSGRVLIRVFGEAGAPSGVEIGGVATLVAAGQMAVP